MKLRIKIDGMSCGHCKKRVEEILNTLEGTISAQADLKNNEAILETDSIPQEQLLSSLLDDDGYSFIKMEEI